MSNTTWQTGIGAFHEGAALLGDVETFLRRFVAFPTEAAAVASVLWVAHTHALDAFDSTPRLAFLSPEPGSGKTRALEIVETLVPHPMAAVNATPAALFRAVADMEARPTILFDEIDTVFGPKAKDNEELRGLLNAGHRRSGVSYRCVGDGANQKVMAFPSFAGVALAGLGDLPDTILTRSVVIRMRRRAPHEKVQPYRQRLHESEGNELRGLLAQWAHKVSDTLTTSFPDMPDGVEDRPADVWEPLISVADAAGEPWPDRARQACVNLVSANTDTATASLGIRLLGDLREVFARADKLPTAVILERLCALDDAPWGDLRGKPMDARGLAKRLREYTTANSEPIKARTVRTEEGTPKGYHAEDLHDAWSRYLAPASNKSATSDTPAEASSVNSANPVADSAQVSATQPPHHPVAATPLPEPDAATSDTSATPKDALTSAVAPVADVADLSAATERPKQPCAQCRKPQWNEAGSPYCHACRYPAQQAAQASS